MVLSLSLNILKNLLCLSLYNKMESCDMIDQMVCYAAFILLSYGDGSHYLCVSSVLSALGQGSKVSYSRTLPAKKWIQ